MTSFIAKCIQLVGYANNDPHTQLYLGQFGFKREKGIIIPFLYEPATMGSDHAFCDLANIRVNKGRESFDVPSSGQGHGLHVSFSDHSNQYHFVTGLRPQEWGSSGKLAPGCEAVFELMRQAATENLNHIYALLELNPSP